MVHHTSFVQHYVIKIHDNCNSQNLKKVEECFTKLKDSGAPMTKAALPECTREIFKYARSWPESLLRVANPILNQWKRLLKEPDTNRSNTSHAGPPADKTQASSSRHSLSFDASEKSKRTDYGNLKQEHVPSASSSSLHSLSADASEKSRRVDYSGNHLKQEQVSIKSNSRHSLATDVVEKSWKEDCSSNRPAHEQVSGKSNFRQSLAAHATQKSCKGSFISNHRKQEQASSTLCNNQPSETNDYCSKVPSSQHNETPFSRGSSQNNAKRTVGNGTSSSWGSSDTQSCKGVRNSSSNPYPNRTSTGNTSSTDRVLDSASNPHLAIEHEDADAMPQETRVTPTKSPYQVSLRPNMFVAKKGTGRSDFDPRTYLIIFDCMNISKSGWARNYPNVLANVEYQEGLITQQHLNAKRKLFLEESARNGSVEKTLAKPESSRSSEQRTRERPAKRHNTSPPTSVVPPLISPLRDSSSTPPSERRLPKRERPRPSPRKDSARKVEQSSASPVLNETSSRLVKHQANYVQTNHVAQNDCDRKIIKQDMINGDTTQCFTSKKDRRAVYSGKKSGHNVPTLKNCCLRVLHRNLDGLKFADLKKVPYETLAPLLAMLSSSQLFKLEERHKYLIRQTDHLWRTLCNREYRGKNPVNSGSTWRDTYQLAARERDQKLKDITAGISAHSSKTKPERQMKVAYSESPAEPSRKRTKMTTDDSGQHTLTNGVAPSLKSAPRVSPTAAPPTKQKQTPKERSHSSKSGKKDAPLMSKVKKTMSSLAYRTK